MISSAWLVLTGLGWLGSYLVSSKANDAPDSATRIMQKMDLVDAQIPETLWIGGDGPVVADFFATEAFEVMGL
ncbi:MAG: hypothetical protein M3O46_23220 [Myxococcota bacterium]|nr:hypothetical protein [Myxococcota bacterium]